MVPLLAVWKNGVVRLLEYCVVCLTAILVIDVVWQVATRYLLNSPSSWTEELANILLVWVALLGAAVAFIRHGHLGIDFLVSKLNGKRRALVDFFVYLLIAFFAASVMIYGGYRLVSSTFENQQISPALGLERGYVYLILPISGFFILISSVETALKQARAFLKS